MKLRNYLPMSGWPLVVLFTAVTAKTTAWFWFFQAALGIFLFCLLTVLSGDGWFRIRGHGIAWKWQQRPLFSERHGYQKPFLKVGVFRFFRLRPNDWKTKA